MPSELPAIAYRVDGGARLYVDPEEAVSALKDSGERLVSWTLSPCGRQYDLTMIAETTVEAA